MKSPAQQKSLASFGEVCYCFGLCSAIQIDESKRKKQNSINVFLNLGKIDPIRVIYNLK